MKNKNKSLKIVLGIIITLIVLVICFIILIITEVIPNPFLDTKDLVCEAQVVDDSFQQFSIFKFNKKAQFIKYIEKAVLIFESEEDSKKYYEELMKQQENKDLVVNYKSIEINLENNKININYEYDASKYHNYYGKTKKQIKEFYNNKYGIICE